MYLYLPVTCISHTHTHTHTHTHRCSKHTCLFFKPSVKSGSWGGGGGIHRKQQLCIAVFCAQGLPPKVVSFSLCICSTGVVCGSITMHCRVLCSGAYQQGWLLLTVHCGSRGYFCHSLTVVVICVQEHTPRAVSHSAPSLPTSWRRSRASKTTPACRTYSTRRLVQVNTFVMLIIWILGEWGKGMETGSRHMSLGTFKNKCP